ncbi:MAG: hypothetical protein FWG05_00555 [Kiritimatiellaeota bacterium]|nr:hypothetical protein [Kiritimatiellota bacterium]
MSLLVVFQFGCQRESDESAGVRNGYSFTVELDAAALENIIRERESEDTADDEIKAKVADTLEHAADVAVNVIHKRMDALGIKKPVVTNIGERRIQIRISNVTPEQRDSAERLIKSAALLEFRFVSTQSAMGLFDAGVAPAGYKIVKIEGNSYYAPINRVDPLPAPVELYNTGKPPAGCVFMLQRHRIPGYNGEGYSPIYVSRRPLLTGANIAKAGVETDQLLGPQVRIKFDSEGRRELADITAKYSENGPQNTTGESRQLAIVIDGIVYSAPRLVAHITSGSACISGNFTQEEVRELAIAINSGAMPVPLKIIECEQFP